MRRRLEIEPEEPDAAPSRGGGRSLCAAGVAVLMVALAGGLWAGYRVLGHRAAGDVIPILHADDRPIKIAPVEPGGMAVPDQDIYVLNDKQHPLDARVEQILPPPETPLPRPTPPEADAATAPADISEDAAPAPAAAPLVPLPPETSPATASVPPLVPQVVPPVAPVHLPTPVMPPQRAVAANAPPPPPPPPAAVSSSNTLPPRPAVAPPRPAMPPPRPAPPPQTASLPPARTVGGSYRLQLGATRSLAAAQQEWDRLKRLQPGLLGKLHADAVRYDLGERGIIYRIQAGPIADAVEADRLCHTLKQRNLGCFLVRP